MARTKVSKQDKEIAVNRLRELVPEGSTIYGIVRSVSKSGMSRRIDFYAIVDNKPVFLSHWIHKACGYSHPNDNKSGLLVQGCGMDMIFAVVYDVAQTIYNDGYKIKHESI